MIEINNIEYNYAGSRHKVFENLNLQLGENKIYGLLGKNGTGKSTLLYLISGLLRAKKGSITFDGNDVSKRIPETLEEIFIVPEEYDMPNLSLERFIQINKRFYPHFKEDVLHKCISDFELPEKLNLKALSMGQKKKIYMSFALAAGTKLMLMDEPTNGLDIPSKSLFRKVVAQNMTDDRTLIISTHQVHDIESLLDHIIILENSRLLLDKSVSEITDEYSFAFRQPNEMNDEVIYAEPSLQGNAVITKRMKDDPETQMNLELLFNAVTKGIIKG